MTDSIWNPDPRAISRIVKHKENGGVSGCAVPIDPEVRKWLAELVKDAVGVKFPDIVEGSVGMDCDGCGMELAVGPKLQLKMKQTEGMVILCVFCVKAVSVASGSGFTLESLTKVS